MTQRCYIFAIGGTGSRIIESLVHILASGGGFEHLKNWELVPIIVDLDSDNGNLNNATTTLSKYCELQQVLGQSHGTFNFFKVPIKKLSDITQNATSKNNFNLSIDLTNKSNLRSVIDYDKFATTRGLESTEKLTKLLFSDEDLNMPLNVGFKGNPNIGTIVFGQLAQSKTGDREKKIFKNKDFGAFVDAVNSGDRIFVISSVFGGTGASGLPRLVKELRNLNDSTALNSAIMGGLSVMPYFKVTKDESSKIDSTGFVTMTKSALKYYHKNPLELDALFHIGLTEDQVEYTNHEGGAKQKNDPNIIEFIGATSIIKFLSMQDEQFSNNRDDKGKRKTINMRYGIEMQPNKKSVYLTHFKNQMPSTAWVKEPLTKFYLSSLLVRKILKMNEKSMPWAIRTNLIKSTSFFGPPDRKFFSEEAYTNLDSFMGIFLNFFKRMGNGSQDYFKLDPFDPNPNVGSRKLDDKDAKPFNEILKGLALTGNYDEINGIDMASHPLTKIKIKYFELIGFMNSSVNHTNNKISGDSPEKRIQKFIELLYMASEGIIRKHKFFG